jgi:hypothetical protein
MVVYACTVSPWRVGLRRGLRRKSAGVTPIWTTAQLNRAEIDSPVPRFGAQLIAGWQGGVSADGTYVLTVEDDGIVPNGRIFADSPQSTGKRSGINRTTQL